MSSRNKYGFSILFFLISSVLSNIHAFSANTADSVKVSGQLKWKETAITRFPPQVKLISRNNASLIIKANVDSLGKYTARVPIGSYTVAPARNYHFIGAQYIKINANTSKISIEVPSYQDVVAPLLELDTIPWPDLMPQKGVMFHLNSKKAKLLNDFIKTYMSFFEIPGASLALIKKGKVIYYKAYGVKNSVTKEPVDEKTLFEAGSVTKPVFAFVVMRLVEKGILDLDKPLYQYLPFEDVAHDDRYKLITARMVLSHQTGFPNWAERNENGQFNLEFTPGTNFGYSGEGFEYLKTVVEHITQKDIGTILEEELLIPLNWKNVYFQGSKYVAEFAAHGHYDNSPTDIRLIKKPMMAYYMNTEAKSFSNFMLALRNKKGLKPETYNEMFKIHSTMEAGVHWGLGFCIEDSPYGLVYRHGGSTNSGFICNFSFFQDIDMGYVLFTNSHMGEWLAIPLLTEFLVTGKKN